MSPSPPSDTQSLDIRNTEYGIKAIIFDVGSVLIREADRTPREQAAARLGMTYDELVEAVFEHPASHQASLGGITTGALWAAIGQSLGLSPKETGWLYETFFAGNRVDDELVELARSLRASYTTAILSNAWDDLREVLENVWGIAGDFDHIIVSAEEGVVKPDPRIYHLTLERMGVEPHEAVFIDDRSHNVAAAREVGIHSIHFESTEQARSELFEILKTAQRATLP
ncbi:MAG: HAD family hydrolase [Anaerolineales bacterium]